MSRAVLLIHGFLTDMHDFDPLYDDLNLIYDCVKPVIIPGHDDFDFDKFTVKSTFEAVLDCFDDLYKKYDSIDVIGFSMGGALATFLSNVRQFDNLVLLAPANKFLNFGFIIKKAGFYAKYLVEKVLKRELTHEEEEEINKIKVDDKNSMTMALGRLIPNYNYHTIKTFINITNICNKSLNVISNRTLIVWGKYDQLVPSSSIDYDFKKCINKKSEVVVFDNISHLMLASSANKDIVEKVVSFLNEDCI